MKLGWAALGLIAYTAFVIHRAMPRLPARIPTSFDFQGRPTAGSSPDTLWMMLAIQVAVTALILSVPAIGRRAPQWVNLGWRRLSDYPPAARERIMPLLEEMSGWMAVLFSCFFTVLIRELIRAALGPGKSPSVWPVWFFLAGTAGVTTYYMIRINRTGKGTSSPPGGPSTGVR
jgi:uncharacterized membrane protein